jgi:hypothetical protein
MQNTITISQAEQRAEDHAQRFLETLPAPARPEVTFRQNSDCADPTDGGPPGRVFASLVYQVHDVPAGEVDNYFHAAQQWWTSHEFRVTNNWKSGDRSLRVENIKDSFRMALTTNDAGLIILAADSPCVWPDGRPGS